MKARMFALAGALAGTALFTTAAAPPDRAGARPAITGISHMAVFTTDPAGAAHFYGDILGGRKVADAEDTGATRYLFSDTQWVEVLPAPPQHGQSMVAHVAYATADAAGLRRYLAARGTADLSPLAHAASGEQWFATHDPEGHEVRFVQMTATATPTPHAISGRIIHVGYTVHDRAAEDGFYRARLGFRPYWYGAMHEGATDWVSQQVPDGHDWLEYMLVGPGTTVPLDHVDARERGVLDHFSLGVANMEEAVTRLTAEDRLPPRHDGPQLGRDGKWQANLYDPDGTRVELMEYQPSTEPCCSAFTAPSPTG